MSAQDGRAETALPRSISSPRAKLVYLYLERAGPAPVDDVAAELDLQKLSVYAILRSLRERRLVERRDGGHAVA